MQHAHVPLLGFVAASGTGKTTLLEHIIPILKQQGVRVGLIKHSHHNFQIDQPGKDSFRLRTAGASPVMLVSTHRRAIITEIVPTQEPRLDEELKLFDQSQVDLVLVEGFKALLYPTDPDIIAIASDELLELPEHLPNLDINQPQMIVDFIIKEFMEKL